MKNNKTGHPLPNYWREPIEIDGALEPNPPDFGCHRVWEAVDEIALAIYGTMRFWRHLEDPATYGDYYGLGDSTFEITVASSISGTLRSHFEIERKPLGEKAKLMPWHRKLWRAVRHAYWILRFWNT